jgi:two-component system, NarL family, sensor histidine kinase BarA
MFKFKRTRRYHISLAAKCQLLFGAAVVAVIFAALYWPWKRIEQLTQQLNQNAASAVVRDVIGRHVAQAQSQSQLQAQPTSTRPTIARTAEPTVDGHAFALPRLIGAWRSHDSPEMTRFEAAAMDRFGADPTHAYDRQIYHMPDGSEGYRYAEPQYLRNDCLPCHADGRPISTTQPLPRGPALALAAAHPKQPTTATTAPTVVAAPVLLGLVSVDMPSRIPPNQLLLNHTFLLTAALGAGSLALLVFSYITTRIILAPMRVLQETAEKVSKGDLNVRSHIFTGDEFQQLSETFNTMLVNLKDSADQLRAVNKSLDLKLGQLAETNVALYESNRLKSEFLANVSHELRTPLNSILGFADLLTDQAKSADPKTARYLQNIMSAGNNLLDLINDLLDLAKIEAGRMEVRSEPLSLSDLLEGLANLVRPLAEKKSLQVVSTVEQGMPILQTDPLKLQQILYNFISNAIKFSPPDGRIELSARRDGPTDAIIAVADQGPGIEPAQQEMIFEKFRQIDGSVTRQHSGSGLGLAISRELATLLSGTVGVVSAPAQGATFWIKLPLKIEGGLADVRTPLIRT